MRLYWDLETNGLLDTVTTIHSLHMKDMDTGHKYSCHDQDWKHPTPGIISLSLVDGLSLLAQAELRVGHNTIKYDVEVLKKLFPSLILKGQDRDTMILAKVIHPDIKAEDSISLQSGRLNRDTFKAKGRSLFGSHSLAAWGFRVGEHKTEYTGGFDTWSPEMQLYGDQDIDTTEKLYLHLHPEGYSQDAIELEHKVAAILARVERDGIPFDINKAAELQATLVNRREELRQSLMGLFPDWEVEVDRFIAKVPNKKLGRLKGDLVVKMKTVVFNPGSRDHIARCLKEKYQWVPLEFTETGKPAINDEVLQAMAYPEAKRLAEYFVVCKTLAQLAEGDENWMRYCTPEGVIHAQYNPMGTVTSRCSHMKPNVGQVPSVGSPYGAECRSLFGNAPEGYVLLGSDMSGLELRCLGHYLAFVDGGAYAHEVVNGDVHTLNQKAAGLPTRANAKTFIYGFLYGAGPAKIGSIINGSIAVGKKLINSFLKKTPALSTLRNHVAASIGKGYVNAIDGRRVPVRKKHAALNSLLQSCGGIICKKWMVTIVDSLEAKGLVYGHDYRIVAFIHDELQFLVKRGLEAIVGNTCKESAVAVGEGLRFKCPLAAEYKTGQNWSETH
jgi:DNA polymerase-1